MQIDRLCRNRKRILSLAALICLTDSLYAQRYTFQRYAHQEGLGNASIRALAQDHTGFLWVGTANGLYRFDGSRFLAYGVARGLPGARIWGLHITPDGTLWVNTNAGLAYRQGERFIPVNFHPGSVDHKGTSIASDRSGKLYIACNRGLFVGSASASSQPSEFRRVPLPAALNGVPAFSVTVDRKGAVWFGCGTEICKLDGGAVQVFGKQNGVPQENWTALIQDGEGAIWARSQQRLIRRKLHASSFESIAVSVPPAGSTTALSLDSNGRLIVPTQLGVLWQKDNSWERLGERHGLPADATSCVLIDREGTPWLGFDNHGLARWMGYGEWESWTSHEGLTTNTVSAITRDARGQLWIGTKYGLNRMNPDGTWTSFTTRDGLQHDVVRSVVADPVSGIWIGTDGFGLSYFDDRTRKFHHFGPQSGLTSKKIVSLTIDARNRLWVPTREGLFVAKPNGAATRFEPVSLPPTDQPETIYRVVLSKSGRLWMASTEGLLQQDGNGWKRYKQADGLNETSLAFATEGPDGSIWVAYGGVAGVSRLAIENGKPVFAHYRQGKELRSDDISFLETDRRGRIWVGTDDGIDVFEAGSWRHIGPSNGLIWQDCMFNAFYEDADGSVWIGTTSGVSHYRELKKHEANPPPVVITGLTVARDGDLTAPEYRQTVDYNERPFEIQFAALSFRNPADIRYRYRIPELSRDWIETDRNRVDLHDLQPGQYQFEVTARSGEGTWNPEPAVYTFSILPPWWMTWWFRLAMIVLLLSLAGLIWKLRVRRLLAYQRKLEAAVKERTLQLEVEKRRTEQEKALVEEQKREIERLLREAREANRLKGEFLANVSHEIRTPMNGVLGMTALALSTDLTPEQREYLETVEASGRSLLHLLNDLLDFSKIDAGRMELERVSFSLPDCVDECVKTLYYSAKEKGLDLEVQIAPDTPQRCLGDPVRVRQILLNLLSNAIKFTERGRIEVSTRLESQNENLAAVHFTVSDTGIGIPEDKRALIFDPFRQADGSTTRRYGGTGLGLAICARLVEMMNGRIWVDSQEGQGSQFHFIVTLELDTQPAPALEDAGLECLRILLVDDDSTCRHAAAALLHKHGCNVALARSGREALDLLEDSSFELVLMDVQMPELDGVTTTRMIRARERKTGRRIPIYMLTSNGAREEHERFVAAGANGCFTKPIEPAELVKVLTTVRSRR